MMLENTAKHEVARGHESRHEITNNQLVSRRSAEEEVACAEEAKITWRIILKKPKARKSERVASVWQYIESSESAIS